MGDFVRRSSAHVATATAAQVIMTANYGSGTPAEAADWVHYANVDQRLSAFKYWEIGNENYGSWETDNNTRPHDPYTYASRFKDYYTQMKAVDPTIKIGAVADHRGGQLRQLHRSSGAPTSHGRYRTTAGRRSCSPPCAASALPRIS